MANPTVRDFEAVAAFRMDRREHAISIGQMNTPSDPSKGGSVIALDTGSVLIRMHDSKTTIEYTRPYTRVIQAA